MFFDHFTIFPFHFSLSSLPYLVSHQMMHTLNPNGEHNLAHIYFYLLLEGGGVGGGAFAEVRVGMLGKKEG